MEEVDFERDWRANQDRLWRVAWLICAGEADLAEDVLAAAAGRAWRGWSDRRITDAEAYLPAMSNTSAQPQRGMSAVRPSR
jgi:hypothetical protein